MDAAPVIARGNNVAVFVPPIPDAARPLLQAATKRPMLILAADADRAVALASGLDGAFAVSGLTRAEQRLKSAPEILAISVSDALTLLRRSRLAPGTCQLVVLAWPEQLDEEGSQALEAVMAECDREAQRIILTSQTGPATDRLVERYAFKAMTYGFPPADPSAVTKPVSAGSARYVVARRGQLEETRRRVLDALHPASDDEIVIATTPASREEAAALIARAGSQPPVIVAEAYEIPWLRSLFTPLAYLPLPSAADLADSRAEKLRTRVARVIDAENLDRELLTIAPLLERYDPATVAAGLLKLVAGQGAPPATRTAEPAAAAAPGGVPTFAKVWVGAGRKDNVKPGDIVGAIVNETKVSADLLGKIDVKDLFCLVEVRAEHAEKVAAGLTGVNLRGRRLTARVDRGAGHKPPRRV